MSTRTLLIAIFVAVLVGMAIDRWVVPGIFPPPAPPVAAPQQNTATVSDSERAALYADGFFAGTETARATMKPIIRTVTVGGQSHTEIVYDTGAVELARQIMHQFDSLVTLHEGLKDIVAHDVVAMPPYHSAELFYAIGAQSFAGSTVTCTKPDSVRTEFVARDRTFWQRFGWGPQAQVTLVTFGPGKTTWFPGGSLGIGIHYSF